jgi:hypothetical protein
VKRRPATGASAMKRTIKRAVCGRKFMSGRDILRPWSLRETIGSGIQLRLDRLLTRRVLLGAKLRV